MAAGAFDKISHPSVSASDKVVKFLLSNRQCAKSSCQKRGS